MLYLDLKPVSGRAGTWIQYSLFLPPQVLNTHYISICPVGPQIYSIQ